MRVTILTCTPDVKSKIFKKHSSALQNHTTDFEWLIIDNNNASDFNHANEINRAISIASGKYLIILDDDLMVTKNWLEGLLISANRAEIVGGVHRYKDGEINHAGGYILSDGSAGHYLGQLEKTIGVQYVCSAVMLINLEFIRKNKLYFDEKFSKYFQETDFCLRVWQSGGRVVVTNKCDVFHLVGQVTDKKSDRYKIYGRDSNYFNQKWIKTKKLNSLMKKIKNKLDGDYYNSIKTISKLLIEHNKALKTNNINTVKIINKKSKAFINYGHGKKIRNESALYIKNYKAIKK